MSKTQKRRVPKQYHDYDKDPFCITEYRDSKRPDSKWIVRNKLSGKWERKFFLTKREAETYVDIQRVALPNQGKEGVSFPTELRVIAQRCADKLSPFGKTIDEGTEFYIKHLETEQGSVPVEQAVEEFIEHRRKQKDSSFHISDLNYHLGRFVKSFAGRSVASLETKEIDAWLHSLGVGAVTQNTFRRDARALLEQCVIWRYCANNEAAKTQRMPEPYKDVPILSVEHSRRLIACASDDMLPFWTIGLFAGLRASEIRRLKWEDVDFSEGLIAVRSKKTEQTKPKRYIEMEQNLIKWLRPYQKRTGSVIAPVNFRKERKSNLAAAGLTTLPVNIMRHSYGSYWLAEFNNINALALKMGNSPKVIEKHYKQAVRPKEAHEFWKIAPKRPGTRKVVQFIA